MAVVMIVVMVFDTVVVLVVVLVVVAVVVLVVEVVVVVVAREVEEQLYYRVGQIQIPGRSLAFFQSCFNLSGHWAVSYQHLRKTKITASFFCALPVIETVSYRFCR